MVRLELDFKVMVSFRNKPVYFKYLKLNEV